MKVVTVINEENNFFFNLLKLSCAVNKLQLVVLVSNQFNFFSRRIKDELLKDYLEEEENQQEIILFTDGTDAIFTAGEEEILEKFYASGKELLFSAETSCWPDPNLAQQYPGESPTPYRFLNSGGFIGKGALIRELLEDNDFDLENFGESNQYLWTKRYFKNTHRMGLDSRCELFCTFSPEIGEAYLPKGNSPDFSAYYRYKKQWFEANFPREGTRIRNAITHTQPCHLHFNGTAKHLIDDDLAELVYARVPGYKKTLYYYEQG